MFFLVILLIVFISVLNNAVMDIIYSRYDKSIFTKIKNTKLREYVKSDWRRKYKSESLKTGNLQFKKFKFLFWSFRIPMFIHDAWHLSKGIFVNSLLGLISYLSYYEFSFVSNIYLNMFIVWSILGLFWVLIFNLFYHIVFIKKEERSKY
jgi:hypothetical protein